METQKAVFEKEAQKLKQERNKLQRQMNQAQEEMETKDNALNELKDDFKSVIEFKNQQEALIENQNEQLEQKRQELESMSMGQDDRDRELERLRKAVGRLEDRRKHDAKTIYKLELEDKKRQTGVKGLQSDLHNLYDNHQDVQKELTIAKKKL